jgi:hypothetical protein
MRHQALRATAPTALAIKRGKTATLDDVRTPIRDFASLLLWVSAFLGAGYLLLWKPLLDRWIF